METITSITQATVHGEQARTVESAVIKEAGARPAFSGLSMTTAPKETPGEQTGRSTRPNHQLLPQAATRRSN
jgi:hypothetical protein